MRNRIVAATLVWALTACSSGATSSTSSDFAPSAHGNGPSSSDGNGSATGGNAATPPSMTGGGSLGGTSGGGSGAALPGSSGAGAASTGGGATTTVPDSDGGLSVGPGILTAGTWDDNLNYPFFGKYRAAHASISGDPGFLTIEFDAANTFFATRTPRTIIDAALVLDTTGSMGDELSYLTSEFAHISAAIRAQFPNADQRWALVVYRDTPDSDPGDAYVVNSYDFTADPQAFAATIGQQSAANGGDYPESPEMGIERLPLLGWRAGANVAKIAFWVADAPPHTYRSAAMKKAIGDAGNAGIHLYPVSASGTDDLLELTMRSAAAMTGGRYTFLTNDSGVGGAHKVPEIPCYYVTKLNAALVRAVSMELSGVYAGPTAADVIRTSGSPAANGTCTTEDGQTVSIF